MYQTKTWLSRSKQKSHASRHTIRHHHAVKIISKKIAEQETGPPLRARSPRCRDHRSGGPGKKPETATAHLACGGPGKKPKTATVHLAARDREGEEATKAPTTHSGHHQARARRPARDRDRAPCAGPRRRTSRRTTAPAARARSPTPRPCTSRGTGRRRRRRTRGTKPVLGGRPETATAHLARDREGEEATEKAKKRRRRRRHRRGARDREQSTAAAAPHAGPSRPARDRTSRGTEKATKRRRCRRRRRGASPRRRRGATSSSNFGLRARASTSNFGARCRVRARCRRKRRFFYRGLFASPMTSAPVEGAKSIFCGFGGRGGFWGPPSSVPKQAGTE
jgi:hypothetical protein